MPGLVGGARSFDANGIYSRSLASSANFAYVVGDRIWLTPSRWRGINPASRPTCRRCGQTCRVRPSSRRI